MSNLFEYQDLALGLLLSSPPRLFLSDSARRRVVFIEQPVSREHDEHVRRCTRQNVFGLLPRVWKGLLEFGKVRPDE